MFKGFSPVTILKVALTMLLATAVTLEGHAAVSKKAPLAEPLMLTPEVSQARTSFRRHDYHGALLALADKIEGVDALFIAAESHFRLGDYAAAKRYFETIVDGTRDPVERRKAQIRLFDCEVKSGNTQNAIDSYVAFTKEHKNPTAYMRYSLGKMLFDVGYEERSEKLLRGIPKDSEFFMRARYIIAALNMEKKPAVMVKIFNQIEKLPIVSVEDYAVRELAILAQGRIYAEARREDLAAQAYARVSLAGEWGEIATIETIRTLLSRAHEARLGEGRFARASDFKKRLEETKMLATALEAITRYRKVHEIDWRKPELLTLMARLYVETKRYEDARLAYQELIGHYRPLYESLKNDGDKTVWPYFALDFYRAANKPKITSMVVGVPTALAQNLPDVKEILTLRDRIEDGEKKLRLIEERMRLENINDAEIRTARARQNGLITAYNIMVLKKQKRFRTLLADNINESLAEAEFKRADLVFIEMNDLKKQQTVVHDFQSEKIDAFETSLKKLDEGGAL